MKCSYYGEEMEDLSHDCSKIRLKKKKGEWGGFEPETKYYGSPPLDNYGGDTDSFSPTAKTYSGSFSLSTDAMDALNATITPSKDSFMAENIDIERLGECAYCEETVFSNEEYIDGEDGVYCDIDCLNSERMEDV